MSAWSAEETLRLRELYETNEDLADLAILFDKSTLQILRKLVSMKIYKKKPAPIIAMNKDMIARKICKLLGLQLLTMSNMSREDLNNLLTFLEATE